VRGNRAITPETALRLARYFGNEPEFWLNSQVQYDLAQARETEGTRIEREVEVAD
jgi:addiction module HigA family antidote